MKRMMIVGAAAALLVSACASAGDVGIANPDDAAIASDETTPTTGSSVAAQGELPTESIPEDPDVTDDYDASSSGPGEPGDTPPPADDGESLVLGGGIPDAVATAMADLAAHLGVSVDVIDWVSYENVTWPDGSIGCPQKGMGYTQALVSGFLIVLEVDSRAYQYHGASGSEPFLCMTPTQPLPPGAGGDT